MRESVDDRPRSTDTLDPARVRRWPRKRFPRDTALPVGKWVRLANNHGRRRLVRILEVTDEAVLVDVNHRWAGQALELAFLLAERLKRDKAGSAATAPRKAAAE